MLGEFSMRIRELFPNAKMLTTLNAPTHEMLESAGQCILTTYIYLVRAFLLLTV